MEKVYLPGLTRSLVKEMRHWLEQRVDESRAMRGKAIYQLGQVETVAHLTYHVNSQSGHDVYSVEKRHGVWECSCPDYIYRKT
jgi:hypothetical protein